MGRYFPDLVEEYKATLANLKASGGHAAMERELKEAISWMETGYDPAEYRAASRTDAYSVPHDILATYNVRSIYELTTSEESSHFVKQLAELFLMFLTDIERNVLFKVSVDRLTFVKVAEELKIGKGSVQSYKERALKKIEAVKNLLSIFSPYDLEQELADNPMFIEQIKTALQRYQEDNKAFYISKFKRYLVEEKRRCA